ncbi:MAG: hypothetical protein DME65_10090 [Verrucomicrobia bacterium]|nr:MAG: hypothetical protein DME65_10090 [Verrucomicrobiota bacterium]
MRILKLISDDYAVRQVIAGHFAFCRSERSEEWSESDERHGRECREGSGERVGRRTSSISDQSWAAPNGNKSEMFREACPE